MSDSLVINNEIELLGGGVASLNPRCLGARFQLQPGFDLGAPQPTTDFVASMILDGERPFGRRAGNRTLKIPVTIFAPNRRILAAAREVLQQAVDQDIWTLVWTRDPGPGGTPLPLVIDCFRAQPSVPVYNTLIEKQVLALSTTLTVPALPYGRSSQQQQFQFASPAPVQQSPPPPPAPVVLDTFSTISSPQFFQSTQCVIGPFTACWDPDRFGDFGGQVTPLTYSAVLPAPVSLMSMTTLQMYLGLGSRYYRNLDYQGATSGVAVYISLTDSNGVTLSFSRSHLRVPCTPVAQFPVFTRVTMQIPQNVPGFDYASVAAYSITICNRQDTGIRRLSWVTAYIDNLAAYPSTQTVNPVVRGSLYTLYGLMGTARAPVGLAFQQPPTPGTPTVITAAGAGTYTVPAGTAYLKVEGIGAGGPGATMTVSGTGGGGGGGEYAREDVFPGSAGDVIPYIVGTGGTSGAAPTNGSQTVFGPDPDGGTLTLTANGGLAAAENSATGGLGGSGSANSVHFPGGAGRTNPANTLGGGGGSSGGSASPGQTPVGTGQSVFTSAGSNNWTSPITGQVFVETWGAGASGATGSSFTNGGGGGGGEYSAGWLNVTSGTVYHPVVGSGGASVSGSDVNGNNGGNSSFTGDNGTITGHGGFFGQSARTQGGGAGGSGSGAPVEYPGGNGGPANPYSGSGGSSAGPGAAGNTGSGYGGATPAPSGGGAGGAGSGTSSNPGTAGSVPGGGGGGTYTSAASGAGASGQVRLTYAGSAGTPTSNGGAAVTGGGAGGSGGASAGTAGSSGSQPGGGGGGGFSGGSTEAGGSGGNGQLTITPYASAPFRSLIVHRPPLGALKTFQPLVSVGAGNDAPDGTHEYRMPQPLTGLNADFGGTYTIYLIAASLSGSGQRTITVSVNQYEYAGGPKYTVTTLPITITPAQVVNGIITAGVLTLPLKAVAPDNTQGYYTVTPEDSNSADRFYDCIFLDTMGSSVVINEPSSGYINYYIDIPDPNLSLGRIMGSQNGRPAAISVMDNSVISGPAMAVEPADGDNQLFAYSADAVAPSIYGAFWPSWYFDRDQ